MSTNVRQLLVGWFIGWFVDHNFLKAGLIQKKNVLKWPFQVSKKTLQGRLTVLKRWLQSGLGDLVGVGGVVGAAGCSEVGGVVRAGVAEMVRGWGGGRVIAEKMSVAKQVCIFLFSLLENQCSSTR